MQDGVKAGRFHAARYSPLARPTTDLYFFNAMRHAVKGPLRSGRIRPIGFNSFRVDDCAVVVRQDQPHVIRDILARPWRRLIYVIDDNIEAGLHDGNLSDAYRCRLRRQYVDTYAPMIAKADIIVTGSDRLAKRLSEQVSLNRQVKISHIDPHWGRFAGAAQSFSGTASSVPGRFRIAYLGAQSHTRDFETILPVLSDFLADHRDAELVTFLDTPSVRRLADSARVRINAMRTWVHYRRWVGTERFDLAVYPVIDTEFNQSRSVNKLIEHVVVGAVGIYSAGWYQARHLTHGDNAFLADGSVAWRDALEQAISDRAALAAMFAKAKRLAASLDDPSAQQAFWERTLAL